MPTISETKKITKGVIEAAWKRRSKDLRIVTRDTECRSLALITNWTNQRWEHQYRPRGIDPSTGKRWPNETDTLGDPSGSFPRRCPGRGEQE